MDDVAEDAIRAAARAHIEKNVAAAVAVVRSTAKSRDPTKVVAVRFGGAFWLVWQGGGTRL
jgi:hypothetical protein